MSRGLGPILRGLRSHLKEAMQETKDMQTSMSGPDHSMEAELEAILKEVKKFRESQPFDDGCSNWKERFKSIDSEVQLTP